MDFYQHCECEEQTVPQTQIFNSIQIFTNFQILANTLIVPVYTNTFWASQNKMFHEPSVLLQTFRIFCRTFDCKISFFGGDIYLPNTVLGFFVLRSAKTRPPEWESHTKFCDYRCYNAWNMNLCSSMHFHRQTNNREWNAKLQFRLKNCDACFCGSETCNIDVKDPLKVGFNLTFSLNL